MSEEDPAASRSANSGAAKRRFQASIFPWESHTQSDAGSSAKSGM